MIDEVFNTERLRLQLRVRNQALNEASHGKVGCSSKATQKKQTQDVRGECSFEQNVLQLLVVF